MIFKKKFIYTEFKYVLRNTHILLWLGDFIDLVVGKLICFKLHMNFIAVVYQYTIDMKKYGKDHQRVYYFLILFQNTNIMAPINSPTP